MQTWVVPTVQDVKDVIKHYVSEKANENTDATANSESAFEPTLSQRLTDLLSKSVVEFRGAVERGGLYPLSVTTGTVAPEAVVHCAVWTAWRLVNSTPNLPMVVITDKGAWSPFQKLYEEACNYFRGLADGKPVVLPSDPTGVDYATEVGDDNPALTRVAWGDTYGSASDYADGQHVDPETGAVTDLPLDFKT